MLVHLQFSFEVEVFLALKGLWTLSFIDNVKIGIKESSGDDSCFNYFCLAFYS